MPTDYIRYKASLKVARYLGRPLIRGMRDITGEIIDEVVHHIDGDKTNDKLENLYVFKNRFCHDEFHQKIKLFEKELRKCKNDEERLKLIKEYPVITSNLDELKERSEEMKKLYEEWQVFDRHREVGQLTLETLDKIVLGMKDMSYEEKRNKILELYKDNEISKHNMIGLINAIEANSTLKAYS